MAKLATLLIGDDDPEIALERMKALEAAGYAGYQVADPASLKNLAAKKRPDLILLGRFDDIGAINIAADLLNDAATSDIPVVSCRYRRF